MKIRSWSAVLLTSLAVILSPFSSSAEVRSINSPFAKLVWGASLMGGQFSSDEIAVHASNLRKFGARLRSDLEAQVYGCTDPEDYPSDLDVLAWDSLEEGCVIVRSLGLKHEKLENCLRLLPETNTQDICQFSFTDAFGETNVLWMKVQNFNYLSPVKLSERTGGEFLDFQCSPEWGGLVVRREGGHTSVYSADEWLKDDGVPGGPLYLTIGLEPEKIFFAATPAFSGLGTAGGVFEAARFLSDKGEQVDLSGLASADDFLSQVRFFSAYHGSDAVARSMVNSFSARSNGYDKIEAAFSVQVNDFRIDWGEASSIETSLRVICEAVLD